MEEPYKCAVKYLVDLIMWAKGVRGRTLGWVIKSTQTTHTYNLRDFTQSLEDPS